MRAYKGWHYTPAHLEKKFKGLDWFIHMAGYLQYRFFFIRDRFVDTFRYVDPSPSNAQVFSYEYASLLRDIGSVFGSVMDIMVKETKGDENKRYDIRDYKQFLIDNVDDVDLIGVEMSLHFDRRLFFPYKEIKTPKKRLVWWDAHNNVKHSDISNFTDGCLSNVLYGLASLAILYVLIIGQGIQPFFMVGSFREVSEDGIFPIPAHTAVKKSSR